MGTITADQPRMYTGVLSTAVESVVVLTRYAELTKMPAPVLSVPAPLPSPIQQKSS